MFIRQETEKDYKEVYQLVKEAFATAEHADGNEQDLVEALRKSGWEAGEKYGWRAGEKQGKERGTREGISRFAKLSGILLRQNQQAQLLRASEDEQYRVELFRKYEI